MDYISDIPKELILQEIIINMNIVYKRSLALTNKQFYSLIYPTISHDLFNINKSIIRQKLPIVFKLYRIYNLYTIDNSYTLIIVYKYPIGGDGSIASIRYTKDKWISYTDEYLSPLYCGYYNGDYYLYTLLPNDKTYWFALRNGKYYDNNNQFNYSTSTKDEWITNIYCKKLKVSNNLLIRIPNIFKQLLSIKPWCYEYNL